MDLLRYIRPGKRSETTCKCGLRSLILGAVGLCLMTSGHAKPLSDEFAPLPKLAKMPEAGLLLLDYRHRVVKAKADQSLFVPASTTKLVTAFLALSHWGAKHRFHTDFFLVHHDQQVELRIKGYGDPFLTSERLNEVAVELSERLRARGIERIDLIGLDESYFERRPILPGTGWSDNPYDAIPSALAANFNTVYLQRSHGQIRSAEPQTPLTPLAEALGDSVEGRKRINLGRDPENSERYLAELLAQFLRQSGIEVGERVVHQRVGEGTAPFYRYSNPLTLAEMVRPMMRYSTNFIANQFALMLSAEQFGPPASPEKVRRMFARELARHFDWQGAYLEDGAGLSRNNRLSPRQLIDVLQAFRPWQSLLPEVEQGVWAKSGTLIGVSTLAGYIERRGERWPFALMINQRVPYHYRNRVAQALSREIHQGAYLKGP